jgi:hypothetical protein
MIRSHALPTNDRLIRTMGNMEQDCPCGYLETDHHIFVQCKLHEKEIEKAIEDVAGKVAQRANCDDNSCDSDAESLLKAEFRSIFEDSDIWPGRMLRWYYGHVSQLATPLPEKEKWWGLKEIHFQLVRLAGFVLSMRAMDKYQSGMNAVQEQARIVEELAMGRIAN